MLHCYWVQFRLVTQKWENETKLILVRFRYRVVSCRVINAATCAKLLYKSRVLGCLSLSDAFLKTTPWLSNIFPYNINFWERNGPGRFGGVTGLFKFLILTFFLFLAPAEGFNPAKDNFLTLPGNHLPLPNIEYQKLLWKFEETCHATKTTNFFLIWGALPMGLFRSLHNLLNIKIHRNHEKFLFW